MAQMHIHNDRQHDHLPLGKKGHIKAGPIKQTVLELHIFGVKSSIKVLQVTSNTNTGIHMVQMHRPHYHLQLVDRSCLHTVNAEPIKPSVKLRLNLIFLK